MLDTDAPAADDTTTPALPRRRRAASRPAGPPVERAQQPAGTDQTPEPPLEAAAPDDAEPAEAARHDTAVEPVEAVHEDTAADEDAAAEPVEEPQASGPDHSATEQQPVDDPAIETETAADEATTGPDSPPSAGSAPEPEPAGEAEPGTDAETGTESDPVALVPETPEGADPVRSPITDVTVEAATAEPGPQPLSLGDLPTLEELAPRTAEPRGRRRRRSPESSGSPAAAEASAADPVAESLDALSRSRGRRRTRKSESEAAAALDELVAALGGHRAGEAEAGIVEDQAGPAAELAVAAEDSLPTEIEIGSGEEPEDEVQAEPDADGDDHADADAADDDATDDDSGEGPRRRRRRRGGRRRRRGGALESADEDDSDAAEAEAEVDGEAEAGAEDAGEASDTESDAAIEIVEGGTSTRRRRRRRRRGEDTTGSDDDPTDVVVRVRQPRRSKGNDEVTGIDGSTRMEAKRQRRREGRAAGRRRAPILSEAEFLARREAVDRTMLIRQADDYAQIAVLEDGVLVEHYVDRASATSMIGNVYLGKVQNVLPSMEAAFIDIGRGRNAVLYAGEVDWDAFGVTGGDRKMEKVFKSGQSVLVQVSKDPVGAKGARLTAHVSIPGRYVVYSPSGQLSGISRKLPEGERARLKGILDELVGDSASVIVRTAAEGASEDELVRDVSRLKAQWEVIEKKVKAGKSPTQLYAEPDLTVRIVRDLFTEDFGQLIVDGNGKGEDAWDTVDAYVSHVAPHLKERLVHWDRSESGDLFAAHRLDEQIAKALERKVFLPSGGSLIIDRTEAMTVIDVNTGKFTGTSGNLEATVTSNNLEAAEEIVRQLRLRDIGGIIVVDFIDMVLPANRELLLRRLVECLGRDRTRHQVAEVTSLGLVQMTRKKIGTGLAEAFTVTCETCHGRGYHRHETPVDTQAPADGGEREPGRRRRH